MNGDDPQDDSDRAGLVCIARTLGVPVETFFTAGSAETPDIETAGRIMDDLAQAAQLLRLFARLNSPEARARCLAYVVREATRDG